MKLGVSIVTCDRPVYLSKCIESLNLSEMNCPIVIVDNGASNYSLDVTKKLAAQMSCECYVIDGKKSNSPHGQNLAFDFLVGKGVDFVLKSDDDIEYDKKYLSILLNLIEKYDIGAVGGTCWSRPRSDILSYSKGRWYNKQGKDYTKQMFMYRAKPNLVLEMNFLHGGFIYNVKDALKLREITQNIRGGVFGEYFSPVAYREETEFTYLLKRLLNRKLLFSTEAESFHHYAKGGIRKHKDGIRMQHKDERACINVMNALGIPWNIDCCFDKVIG